MNKKILILSLSACFLLSGCFRTRSEIAREKQDEEVRTSLQQNVVEANQAVEKMQAEIGRLNGKIEELEFQRKKEQSAFGASRDASDKSVAEMKARLEEMQKNQATLFDELKRVKEENVQLLKNQGSSRPRSGSQKKAGFKGALSAYKAKKYDVAVPAFRDFLEASPKSKKALDAHYLLGDSLYRQKKYSDAILEFSVVHEKSPASALGRKSTLKIAQSFKALGKDKDAKAFAAILVQSSPKSAEAKKARKFLK